MVTRSFASNYTGPKREKKNFKGEEKCTYLQKNEIVTRAEAISILVRIAA